MHGVIILTWHNAQKILKIRFPVLTYSQSLHDSKQCANKRYKNTTIDMHAILKKNKQINNCWDFHICSIYLVVKNLTLNLI